MDPVAPEERRRSAALIARWSSIIFLLPSSMGVGFFIGHWGDGRLNTTPWLTLAGFLLGSFAGLYQSYRIVSGRE